MLTNWLSIPRGLLTRNSTLTAIRNGIWKPDILLYFFLFSLKDNAKDCFCRLDHLPEERVDLVFPVSEVAALDKVVRLLAPAAGGGVLLGRIFETSIPCQGPSTNH